MIVYKAPLVAALPALSRSAALPLRVNFSWTLAGLLTYAFSQYGMLVAIARLGSPERVGQFALGLAISSPVILLANLELRSILSTDALREFRFQDYLGLRLLTTLLALGVIAALPGTLGESGEIARVILALGVFRATEALSDLQYGLFQQKGRNDRMGRSLMLRGPVTLACLAGGLALTGSVFWGVAAMAVGAALVLVLHDIPSGITLLRTVPEPARPRWHWRVLGRLALISAPLGLGTMLFALNASLPSLLLQKHSGVASVGVFAVLLSLMMAGHVGVNAIGQSAHVRLAAQYAAGDARGFGRLLSRMLAAVAVLGASGLLGVWFLGEPLLRLCFGPAYAQEAGVLRWLMVAGAAGYLASTLSVSMTASRRLRIQPVLMLASVAVTFGLGWALIPHFGLRGAAFAVLGSSLFQLGANLWVTLCTLGRLRASAPGHGP